MISEARIAEYYDYTLPYYDNFWHGHANAVHYGFRDETTATHEDELLNTNRFMASAAAIREGDRILDAGCGIGGSSLWLASEKGASVVGITLSARQVRRARSLARRQGLEDRVSFEQKNVLANGFEDSSFDVVWALESMCYLGHSEGFLREARRLLRPGGRLVIGDGFLFREPHTAREQRWLSDFVDGLVLPGLTPTGELHQRLDTCGFGDIRYWDQTPAVKSSARRMLMRCTAAYPLAVVGERLRLTEGLLTRNMRAGIAQYGLIERGVAGYAVFVATKPA